MSALRDQARQGAGAGARRGHRPDRRATAVRVAGGARPRRDAPAPVEASVRRVTKHTVAPVTSMTDASSGCPARRRWPGTRCSKRSIVISLSVSSTPGPVRSRRRSTASHRCARRQTPSSAGSDARPAAAHSARLVGRRILQVAVVVLVLALGYLAVSLYQVWSTGRSDQARNVDAIVVMGAAQYDGRPSPQLAARLDHAVELWNDGFAPLVVVTGGKPGGRSVHRGRSSANYLVDRGVPAIRDRRRRTPARTPTTRWRRAPCARRRLRGRRCLIVTDPYHSLRSRLTAEEQSG